MQCVYVFNCRAINKALRINMWQVCIYAFKMSITFDLHVYNVQKMQSILTSFISTERMTIIKILINKHTITTIL